MNYCIYCLQPDTRPNSEFRDGGVCPACDYSRRLKEVDWGERYEILQNLIEKNPRTEGQFFDCIIGVSGGKDSSRQALWIRDKLGLKPLLVCLNYPPQQVTQRGCENLSNLINLGFDVVVSGPAPETWRKLAREGFLTFTNWARSTEMALYSSVPQIAIRYKIPLIFWGENPGVQLGDLKTLGKTGYDGNNLRNMNTLSGGGIDWMFNAGFVINQLTPYQYPSVESFETKKIQIVYLGWFLGDWSLINNGVYSSVNGLKIRDDFVENTGDLAGVTALDEDWVTLNQMIKYYKYGFGRVTDYVNEEIRLGRLSRARGIELVDAYDHSCGDEYITSFCEFIELDKKEFWTHVRGATNKDLFYIDNSNKIIPKFQVGVGLK
ncbi:N-acetyl sugar amidotransferase [Candidatus Puniceispirillum sp.]|nr:N-acetyl sugar amidotransferase [Candidatus Puniceispirillum sp.]